MIENKGQQEAINTVEGQLLVIAGPGSGKTTTMINRIGHMVNDCHIAPNNIMMITFTKAAADEMKSRYINKYGPADGILFSTIHALCWRILRFYEKYDKDQVLQEYETKAFFYDAIKRDFSINDKETFVTNMVTQMTAIKNNLIRPEDYIPTDIKPEKFRYYYNAYEKHKKDIGKIDFDDMQLLAMNHIKTHKDTMMRLRQQFKYIMVDEYQDTNIIQRNIIYMISGPEGNLAVVGDDDQSIYAFRGAKPQIMLNFTKDYPKAKEVHLDVNYRSLPNIVQKSQHLIRHNSDRFEKDLKSFRTDGDGIVMLYSYDDRESQMEGLSDSIRKDLSSGFSEKEIAVLYRTNQQSERVADALMQKKLPFYSNDTFKCKYEHWIYRDVWAYHRLAEGNPERGDIFQVINHPNRYLSKECAFCGLDQEAMIQAAIKGKDEDWKIDSAILNVQRFFTLLKSMKGKGPAECMESMKGYQYNKYLEDYEYEDAATLLEIWDQLAKEAAKCSGWDEWELYARNYVSDMKASLSRKEGVCLSTMHKAKGLEWKKVYIIDAVNGINPFAKASGPDQEEEERRLFYVALTRAKDIVNILTYDRNGAKKLKISPYIQEMKEKESSVKKELRPAGSSSKEKGPKVPVKLKANAMAMLNGAKS